jgi:hypothetical protein
MVDLNMWQLFVKFVPWLLTDEQKQSCLSARNCWMKSERPKLPLKDHNRWQKPGFTVTTLKPNNSPLRLFPKYLWNSGKVADRPTRD